MAHVLQERGAVAHVLQERGAVAHVLQERGAVAHVSTGMGVGKHAYSAPRPEEEELFAPRRNTTSILEKISLAPHLNLSAQKVTINSPIVTTAPAVSVCYVCRGQGHTSSCCYYATIHQVKLRPVWCGATEQARREMWIKSGTLGPYPFQTSPPFARLPNPSATNEVQTYITFQRFSHEPQTYGECPVADQLPVVIWGRMLSCHGGHMGEDAQLPVVIYFSRVSINVMFQFVLEFEKIHQVSHLLIFIFKILLIFSRAMLLNQCGHFFLLAWPATTLKLYLLLKNEERSPPRWLKGQSDRCDFGSRGRAQQ